MQTDLNGQTWVNDMAPMVLLPTGGEMKRMEVFQVKGRKYANTWIILGLSGELFGVSVLLECSWMTFRPEADKQGYVVFNMFLRWIYGILGSAIYSSYC